MTQEGQPPVTQADLDAAADNSRAAANIVLRYIDGDPAVSTGAFHAALRTISDYNRLLHQLHPEGRGPRTLLEI